MHRTTPSTLNTLAPSAATPSPGLRPPSPHERGSNKLQLTFPRPHWGGRGSPPWWILWAISLDSSALPSPDAATETATPARYLTTALTIPDPPYYSSRYYALHI